VRIVSDIHGLERAAVSGVEVTTFSREQYPNRWLRNLRLLRRALGADYLVIHFSFLEVLLFNAILLVIPFQRCRVMTLDFFVSVPKPSLMPFIRFALDRTALLLVYFRDSSRFQQLYDLPASKFEFVPFKINAWELVQVAPVTDGGYIFVGGRSRRDFGTLFEAVKDLPIPVKVLTAREPDIRIHGSTMEGLTPPPNVTVSYNDSDASVFVSMMAAARLVVLPITKETRIQAGISVCLQGLALRKTVIVSEALGVSDVLVHGEVCIVPAGDVAALRSSIETLWNDAALRERYAEAGHRYAWPLAGEDELRRSIVRAVLAFHARP
jgi:glycosyltransferase involved in cell wall biosynthesis